MKKIIYAIFGLFSASIVGCSDMLDTQPTDFYSQDIYWKNEQQVLDALTGCYQALTHAELYNAQTPFMFEAMSPNAFNYDNQRNANDFAAGVHNATTLGMNDAMWKGCYRGIGRCNMLLSNIDKAAMDEDLRARIIGEARFLRAFFYQRLNVLFHGVPLLLDEPNPDEHGNLPRSTYQQIREQILLDLDEAATSLPASYSKADDGRATKGAAWALKARVLLQDHDYQDVVTTIRQIIDLDRYSLYPNYNGLFRKVNEGNQEIVFDIRFKAPELINTYDIIMAQYSTQAPVQGLVDAYQMTDGLSIDESPRYDSQKPYENRDPRFKQSIVFIGAPWRNRTATNADLHQTGYTFRKFTEYNETTPGTLTNSETNYVEIRYADVLLMYAEALNELSGPSSDVYGAINSIRSRPTVDMPPLEEGLSKEEMREAIRLERRIELAGEGSYFYDIRRWKTIEKEMNEPIYDYQGKLIQNRKFDASRDYIWPIPYTEIDLNPALEPNPNY
ncbi:RagB/SusD family nutrient uptake outer membrane protein [Sphingobacterium arenae]|uniref:RagB/SusD family nutrient uptake outer membrane protein n=1 Tax=Sphingobacterium arenae TaxID=1280598 RepID=A0ABR7Y4V4_9SPHI|nr:RagB/SusD family nutrient uptake outer membrane protein [Sphingobacterium arenae]MBD1426347.1 RagB/SusD family nutrient uptake outer membrane protein [Sphingobacterium arenae]